MAHGAGGGGGAGKVSVHDISITKVEDFSSIVSVDVKVLSASLEYVLAMTGDRGDLDSCWIEDHGRDDGNEHNALVHIEIGMPLLGVSSPDDGLL